jgi:hypothetical protein
MREIPEYDYGPCEVCGAPSDEATIDRIWIADASGTIIGAEKRGETHLRCPKHSRRNRSLVRLSSGKLIRYQPGATQEWFEAGMLAQIKSTEAIMARATPHTEEDKAFDRKWWPETCYRWDK